MSRSPQFLLVGSAVVLSASLSIAGCNSSSTAEAAPETAAVEATVVDVPVVKYKIRPAVANPFPANPSAWMKANGNEKGAGLMCSLSASQTALSKDELKKRYKNKKNYQSLVEKRVAELEKAGWSLPMYRELILSDAAKVDF